MVAGADGRDYGQAVVAGRDQAGAFRSMVVDTGGKLVGVYQADPSVTEQPCVDVSTIAPSVLLAAVVGRRHYITDLAFENMGMTACRVQVMDGANRIFSATVAPGSTFAVPLNVPLRGSVNTAVNIVLSMAVPITVSTQGFNDVV